MWNSERDSTIVAVYYIWILRLAGGNASTAKAVSQTHCSRPHSASASTLGLKQVCLLLLALPLALPIRHHQ